MKKSGWENRLTAYIRLAADSPFRPGQLDCALFFAGAVKEIRGDDYVTEWKDKYKSIAKGKAMLQKMGFDDHIAYAESILETWPTPLMAQRGDGAVIEVDGGDALGIVQGEYIYAMGLNGIVIVPLTEAKKAFKI